MRAVEIIQCKGCGANLLPNNTSCDYCGGVNIYITKENPLFMNDESLCKKYVNFYNEQIKGDQSNGKMVFSLGLFYLRLKVFDLAIKTFSKVIDLIPNESDAYFYYSLSILKGRRPKTVTYNEIKLVDQYLNTAIQLKEKSIYIILKAAINYDFYKLNGFKEPEPNYADLLLKVSSISSDISSDNKILKEYLILREGPVYDLVYSI